MFLRSTIALSPCLALFLLACNDNTAQKQAPSPAPSPAVAAQKDQPVDQSAAPETGSAKPAASAQPAMHHHVAYAKHHHGVRHAHPVSAVSETASAAEPAEAAPIPPAAITVPTGTVLSVRLTQELASKTNNAGDAFTATVSEAVMVDGKPLIPEGSAVTGNVTEASPMGALHKGVLQLTLHSININGQDQIIQTSTASEVEKDKTASADGLVGSTGAMTAPASGLAGGSAMAAPASGLAGAGAMTAPASGLGGVGAKAAPSAGLAGGGAMAAPSAGLAGGGLKTEAEAKAGTVVAALTGNRDLIFPARASIKFTLEQPFEIKP